MNYFWMSVIAAIILVVAVLWFCALRISARADEEIESMSSGSREATICENGVGCSCEIVHVRDRYVPKGVGKDLDFKEGGSGERYWVHVYRSGKGDLWSLHRNGTSMYFKRYENSTDESLLIPLPAGYEVFDTGKMPMIRKIKKETA